MEADARVTKARALMKFGEQAYREARLGDAEKALREAASLSLDAREQRLHARVLFRLFTVVGLQGRAQDIGPDLARAGKASVASGGDRVAGLIVQSCFMRYLEGEELKRFLKGFLAESESLAQDLDVARARASVALVCRGLGEGALAAKLIERALPVMEAGLGAAHPDVGLAAYNLADLRGSLEEYRNFAAIEPALRNAIAVQKAALAPKHPERAAPLLTTGSLLVYSGRRDEAKDLLREAFRIAASHEGPQGATTQAAMRTLGALDPGLVDAELETHLIENVQERGLAPLDEALRLATLCRVYFRRGKAEAAEPHYRRLRELQATLDEQSLMQVHAEMNPTAEVYEMMGENRQADAERVLLARAETMRRVLGADHAELWELGYFTGNFYRMSGRHRDALAIFQRLAATAPDHPDVLGRVLDAQLELGQAAEADRTAAQIERVTGMRPVMDPRLNEIARQLQSVWHVLKLAAFPDLTGAALKGDAHACFVVGLHFAAGQGVSADPERAREWLERAANGGFNAARMTLDALGRGAQLDYQQLIFSAAGAWGEAWKE